MCVIVSCCFLFSVDDFSPFKSLLSLSGGEEGGGGGKGRVTMNHPSADARRETAPGNLEFAEGIFEIYLLLHSLQLLYYYIEVVFLLTYMSLHLVLFEG